MLTDTSSPEGAKWVSVGGPLHMVMPPLQRLGFIMGISPRVERFALTLGYFMSRLGGNHAIGQQLSAFYILPSASVVSQK